MEVSNQFQSSQQSVVSPEGKHIATLNGSRLEVRRVSTLETVRAIDIPSNNNSRFLCIRWSPITKGAGASDRFLVSDEDTTRVWDLQDTQWSATIDNGSGGMGKIANVEFGSDDTEIMVFSSFASKVTVWSLWTGKSVEIKDPKFATKGFGRSRPGRTGMFALISRPSAQDLITFHVPGSYIPLKSFALPTVDAQGLKWSPDGRWLAVWDTPSNGYKVLIYTADGNLFRTYSGDYFDDDLVGLGVKRIEWSPNGDFLVVAGFEQTVTLLTTRTFSPAVHLSHPASIRHTARQVWQENVTSTERSYSLATQTITPPAAQPTPGDNTPKVGISILGFSADGSYLATRDDSMPTVVWIWNLSELRCRAVLVQHSVVKRILWHPTNPTVLLIQCIQGESTLYSWNSSDGQPRVLSMPSVKFSGKVEAQWIPKDVDRKPVIMFGDMAGFTLAYPEGRDLFGSPNLKGSDAAQDTAAAASEDDSLYDILSGKHVPGHDENTKPQLPAGLDSPGAPVDDTFQYRKGIGVF